MEPTHCAPFPGSTRVLKLGKSGFRRCSGKLHPPDVGVTRGHPSTTPLGCESLALASCYSGSCVVGQRLERNGTAPPSGHGCASRSSLRAGSAKELHSKGDIIFGKNNCRLSQEQRYPSSPGSAACSSGKSLLTFPFQIWRFCWTSYNSVSTWDSLCL